MAQDHILPSFVYRCCDVVDKCAAAAHNKSVLKKLQRIWFMASSETLRLPFYMFNIIMSSLVHEDWDKKY